MTARRFTATEDKIILNGRKAGVPWRKLGEMLGRDRDTIRNRYDKITDDDRRHSARPPSYCPGPPIPPVFSERMDDSAHVRALVMNGGFPALKRNDRGPVYAATASGLVCLGTWEGVQ